jgi:hypothetical protein
MLWLFRRGGEYLSCEVRTCVQNAGYELCLLRPDSQTIEWYADQRAVEKRWKQLREDLIEAGWGDFRSPRASA